MVDPGYEVPISGFSMKADEAVLYWTNHLENKYWVQPEDLTNLEDALRACYQRRAVELFEPDYGARHSFVEEYCRKLASDWPTFLNAADQKDESVFQRYLERHPSLLPGPHGTPYGRYHGPDLGIAYAQPPLPGIKTRIPDFLILERDSATTYAVLIELEAPGKRWSTKSGRPTAELTQAIDQLREWKIWFANPANVLNFLNLYDLQDEIEYTTLVQHYVLVYGRREEANASTSFAKKRHSLAGADEYLMTYDRLLPNGLADITLRVDQSGPDTKFRAISVAPSFSLDARNAEWFLSLSEIDSAVHANPLTSEAYKQYMADRVDQATQHLAAQRRKRQEFRRRNHR